uniref:Uncharacterized protein n=1 Tax=Anguilla anguilla TaxID=7936 RepID=A0A0E9QUQ7_ANGAN
MHVCGVVYRNVCMCVRTGVFVSDPMCERLCIESSLLHTCACCSVLKPVCTTGLNWRNSGES